MVACVDMAFSVILPPSYSSFSKPASFLSNTRFPGLGLGLGLGFQFQRKRRTIRRHLKLLIGAQLSNSFSFTFGLDSPNLKSFQSHDDLSKLSWRGPVPGDIAEVEAYCRIFRNSERLHSALMDALCNPLTGECSVSYEVPSDERPQLEDKIVSVLGCMVSLVNKGRDDVLTGRSLVMNPFHDADDSAIEDKLPPLAVFRSEMKRCSESLHVALENYLVPDDDRSLNVWRKLQRLKNVCYDSGFPRREGYPCYTLFSNWSPVYFSSSKDDTESEDLETAFWTGGQVTEEGLKWLLDKGFKTIIDIRAENVRDNFYRAAVSDAISSGKIELVKIPVEVMTAPTMEQVVRFASYVSDSSKRPVYLHSKEGVWRSSAMVSRWRQYMTRSSSQNVSSPPIIPSNTSHSTNSSGKLQDCSVTAARSSLENDITSLQDSFDSKSDISISGNSYDGKTQGNAALNGISSDNTILETDVDAANKEGSFPSFITKINPLKAQVPPCDVFSKKVMSNFLGSRKVTSPDYIDYRIKRAKCLPQFKNMAIRGLQGNLIVSNGAIVGPDSLNGSAHVDYPSGEAGFGVGGNGKLVNGNTSSSGSTTVNGFSQGELHYASNANVSGIVNNDNVTTKTQIVEDGTVKAQLSLHDEELRTIEGDMCASSTGVVRVQSRKKAEMFLVRTDGFSCTREKVTESSLAFTHPSTQQQMLMWKSTPKNVLLLKKLGDELLEEAKMEAIEEEDRVIEKDQALLLALLGSCNDRAKQLHASPSGRLLTALVCEYLDWAQLIWRSVGTPFTATTEAGTSSASSSDPGTSPFCIPEMNGETKREETIKESHELCDTSDTESESLSTSSASFRYQPWITELLLHQQSSQRNGERSEAYHGMPQATTTKALLEKYSRLDRGAGMEMSAAYRNDSDFSGNLREAIALSGNAPLGPPPLCSICQHKAPVFGKPPRWFSYAELELATGGFSQANFLAEGGYGSVHRGVLPEGQVIAVKQHKLASSQGDVEFCSEVEVLSSAQHRNVVMLIGFCIEDKRRLLVYEYICNGSLDSHLYGRQRDPLEWSARQKIAVGAARGLRYLHEECRVGCIIHRDMRPNNILITHDFEPLVGDFGLARWQPDGDMGVDTRVIGTFGYLAPEYAQSGQITEKADVYSFGVVLVELVTGRKAVDLTRPKGQRCLTEWARPLLEEYAIDELIDPRLGRLYLEHEVYCMLHAASLCIRRDPHCTPRMSQVLRILEGDMVMDTNYISTPGYDVGNRSGRIWSEPLQRQHHYSGPLLEDSLESSFSGKLSRDKYKPFYWDRSRDKP